MSADSVAEAVFGGVKSRSNDTIYVPGIGRIFTAMQQLAPWLMDWYLDRLTPTYHAEEPVVTTGADNQYSRNMTIKKKFETERVTALREDG